MISQCCFISTTNNEYVLYVYWLVINTIILNFPAGWITSQNQDCWEKYQPQICRWYQANGRKRRESKESLESSKSRLVVSDSLWPRGHKCNQPDSSVHGILQARILEWLPVPFSRGSSQPRDRTRSPTLQADSLPSEPPGEVQRAS